SIVCFVLFIFFFQAEDGIRDGHVTGVQTCALPILPRSRSPTRCCRRPPVIRPSRRLPRQPSAAPPPTWLTALPSKAATFWQSLRSEERRVGKECRDRWAQYS